MPALALTVVAIWFLARPANPGVAQVAAVALLAAFGLTPFVRLIALRTGALDHPDARKTHEAPTPKLGGVAVIAAFVLSLGQRPLIDHELLAIAVCSLVLMLAGAVDDTRGLSAGLRLGLQLVCACAVIVAGVSLNLVPGRAGAAANVALSILWIVGITNAYNFIDGMDGLAASLGALIALLLALFARGAGQPALVAVCAALAIKEDWAEGDPLVALAAPVLIFSVPIYDMIRTTVTRIVSGRVRSFRGWLDYVGRDHIHHRFTALLGGPRPALVLILTLALGLGLSALGLRRGAPGQALIFLIHAALVLLVVAVLEEAAGRDRSVSEGRERRE